MSAKFFALLGAVSAFIGVALGAFGAHALKQRLTADMHAIFEVGVRYQLYHALGLFAVAWAVSQYAHPWIQASGFAMAAGIFIFSGSLYALSLSGVKLWGAVTPIGGILFLIGWTLFALGIWKSG